MIDTLIELGFKKNDAHVYQALVELAPCFVAPIVRSTRKHRQVVYNSLNALLERHLISVTTKNGKNFYSVADPKRILTSLKQKEVLAETFVASVEAKQKKDVEQVEVFAGSSSYEKGIIDFREKAKAAKECLILRSEAKGWFEHTRAFFPKHIDELKKIKRRGVDILMIVFERDQDKIIDFLGKSLEDTYTCKVVPDEYQTPQTAWIAGDHVYILTPAAEPLVVHIKSKSLAEQYRNSFWSMWKKGKILR